MSRHSRSSHSYCDVSQRNDASISASKIVHSFFRWFHNEIEIRALQGSAEFKYVISSSNSLLLLHTAKTDNGKYRCLVTNDAGQDAIDLHLDVYGKDERVVSLHFIDPCMSMHGKQTLQNSRLVLRCLTAHASLFAFQSHRQ